MAIMVPVSLRDAGAGKIAGAVATVAAFVAVAHNRTVAAARLVSARHWKNEGDERIESPIFYTGIRCIASLLPCRYEIQFIYKNKRILKKRPLNE